MGNESSSEDSESIRQIVEVVQYLMVRDQGMRLGTVAHRKAQDTVKALLEKYKLPPIQPP